MLIPVTEEIIIRASKDDSAHCMIADAIKAAMPHVQNVSVDLQTIRFSDRDKGERYVYFTPDPAQQQLLRFDFGVIVEPWVLKLAKRPAQILRIQGHKSRANRLDRPTTPGSRVMHRNGGQGIPTVKGGIAPPLGLLSYSASSHKGRRRQFGVRSAGQFDRTR